MNAAEVMDTNPVTLHPEDTIEKGVTYVMEKRFRSVPVVDDQGCYVGMFGVNCLLKMVIPRAVFLHQLENVSFIHESLLDLYHRFDTMRQEPISICINHDVQPVAPETPLTETLLQLHDTHHSIPVIEPGSCKLCGMISYWDVGRHILAAGTQQHG